MAKEDKSKVSGFYNPVLSRMSMALSDEIAPEKICWTTSSNSSGDFQPLR